MRFKQFINEEEENGLKDMIEQDCAEFLSKSQREGFLVRGMKGDLTKSSYKEIVHQTRPDGGSSTVDFYNIGTRMNRQPSDTPLKTHEMLDSWFYYNLGIKARSQTVFCFGSSDRGVLETKEYGDPYLVFPIGKFKFVWSDLVTDLFGKVDGIKWDLDPDIKPEEAIDHFMMGLEYITNGLQHAVQDRYEIMVACSKYYAFKYEWRPLLEKVLNIK